MSQYRKSAVNRVDSQVEFDPALGYSTRETWVGTPAGLKALAEAFRSAGHRCSWSTREGQSSLEVLIGGLNDGNAETPTDRWELTTEMAQVSIWSHPTIASDAQTGTTAVKKIIEDAVKNGSDLPEANQSAMEQKVYQLLTRGVEAYEEKRFALSRVRSISFNYADSVRWDALEKVYTTDALINEFLVPSAVAARLPITPTTAPENTTWGWRLRDDSRAFIVATNRVEEQKRFIFAAWSDVIYHIV